MQENSTSGDSQRSSNNYSINNNSASNSTTSSSKYQDNNADSWAAFSNSAATFWKQATEATVDIVNIIAKPEETEEDFKFPRPASASTTNSGNTPSVPPSASTSSKSNRSTTSTATISSTRAVRGGSSPAPANSSLNSWEPLDDEHLNTDRRTGTSSDGVAAEIGNGNNSNRPPRKNSAGSSSKNNLNSNGNASVTSLSSLESGSSNNGYDSLPPAPFANSTKINQPPNVSRTSSTGSAKKISKTADSPVGEDFFANFGI